MQSLKESINLKDVNFDLMDSYVKALKNDKFKALVARLKLKENEACKYTSKLERTVEELSNCENCKHLFECKNEVEGFVYYPEKYNDKLNFSYVACQLETGRTHQIRVHMSSISHPLYGDDVYGNTSKERIKIQGQALHAKKLGFIHPSTNKYIEFDSELPAYFEKLLNTL